MKLFESIQYVKKLRLTSLMVIAVIFFSNQIFCQTTIMAIEYQGSGVRQANVSIGQPKQALVLTTIRVNQKFSSGTLFQVPPNTVVWLTSNGNKQRLGPGSKHIASTSAKGESHRTLFGSVRHYVSNVLNFYKASGPSKKYQLAVEGTEFTVQAIGKDVRLQTTEGRVAIQRKVPVKIGEHVQDTNTRKRDLNTVKVSYQNAGDPEQTFAYNNTEEVNFETFDEAVENLEKLLNEAFINGENAEYLANEYTLLGSLYLEMELPHKAIEPFEKTIELYEEIDEDDPLLAENYLDLAEAYYDSGDEESGDDYWSDALEILKDDLNYNLEDYNYFISEEDYETAWSVGMDIVDNYENLGWAYDLVDDEIKANDFYKKSDDLDYNLNK